MVLNNRVTESKVCDIRLDVACEPAELESFFMQRVRGRHFHPELVVPENVEVPSAYVRLRNIEEKDHFRKELLHSLLSVWKTQFGRDSAYHIAQFFLSLSEGIVESGALVLGDLIDRTAFRSLVNAYEQIMYEAGSTSLFHSYVNLRNHPAFLMDPRFYYAFLHPLLIALIAHRVGGPIRIVDARGKDAQPLTAQAQDNMLHIDNTPFRDEYKVLLTWERGKASGPKGQNFVFVPGTQKCVRNSYRRFDGRVWSTENASVFITPHSVNHLFAVQRAIWPGQPSTVIEVKHPDKPMTTVFAAGSLVHHRYRTEKGAPRSCVIVAFHRVADNPGEFMDSRGAEGVRSQLQRCLLGLNSARASCSFLEALIGHASEIGETIRALKEDGSDTIIVEQSERKLSARELEAWIAVVTGAPTVEEIKSQKVCLPLEIEFSSHELVDIIAGSMMYFDKHGPLDLILYDDGHEEVRKWARNRIREMKSKELRRCLGVWEDELRQPKLHDALEIEELTALANCLLRLIRDTPPGELPQPRVQEGELISPQVAVQSLCQLVEDLAESLTRSYSVQNFLSTSLFLFWAFDELWRVFRCELNELRRWGAVLLRHYLVTALLSHRWNELVYLKSERSTPFHDREEL